jgi:hypothetical protein
MSQQANVTLNSVIYAPAGSSDGVATWMNRSGGSAASFSKLTEKFSDASSGGVVRIVFGLSVPVVQATDSAFAAAGTLLRSSTVQVSVWVPSGSTAAERADLLARIQALVAATPFTDAVNNLDPAFG